MQLKSFAAGALAGILLTIGAQQLLGRSDQQVHETQPVSPATSVSEAMVDKTDATPRTKRSDGGAEAIADSPEQETQDIDLPVQTVTTQDTSQSLPIAVTDSHQELLDKYADAPAGSTTPNNVRSEIENEAVDNEWSYFMEQSISQYLAAHPEILYFDISLITCRTTMCEIQAFGVDENAGPRWGLVVHDLKNQGWNDFGKTGSSSSTVDGRLVIFSYLWRQEDQFDD